jgi:hypothetical protein
MLQKIIVARPLPVDSALAFPKDTKLVASTTYMIGKLVKHDTGECVSRRIDYPRAESLHRFVGMLLED